MASFFAQSPTTVRTSPFDVATFKAIKRGSPVFKPEAQSNLEEEPGGESEEDRKRKSGLDRQADGSGSK